MLYCRDQNAVHLQSLLYKARSNSSRLNVARKSSPKMNLPSSSVTPMLCYASKYHSIRPKSPIRSKFVMPVTETIVSTC